MAAAPNGGASPRLSPRPTDGDLRRGVSPVWDEDLEQLTRSMQERMDDFFRSASPQPLAPLLTPGDALSPPPTAGVRGRMETQPDGTVAYKVTFDVRGYEPSDLKTSLIGDRTVRVCGSTNHKDPQTGKQVSASFDEQFTLPDNVDPARLRSLVASDQLTITAPVLPPQYPAAAVGSSRVRQLYAGPGSSPKLSPRSASPSAMFSQQQPRSASPSVMFSQQPQQQQPGLRTASAFQLEVDVGREFEPQDLTVATTDGGRRLTVHGRREVKTAGKTSMREFRDEFELPANVDPGRVTARLRSDGKVVVDMPLLRETAGFTYWPVAVDHRS